MGPPGGGGGAPATDVPEMGKEGGWDLPPRGGTPPPRRGKGVGDNAYICLICSYLFTCMSCLGLLYRVHLLIVY